MLLDWSACPRWGCANIAVRTSLSSQIRIVEYVHSDTNRHRATAF